MQTLQIKTSKKHTNKRLLRDSFLTSFNLKRELASPFYCKTVTLEPDESHLSIDISSSTKIS